MTFFRGKMAHTPVKNSSGSQLRQARISQEGLIISNWHTHKCGVPQHDRNEKKTGGHDASHFKS